MSAHAGVGGDEEPRACPELRDCGFLVLCHSAAFSEHQVHFGSWEKRGR
jgi:hypothetical protein